MTHNDFHMEQDIIYPIRKFLLNVKNYWEKVEGGRWGKSNLGLIFEEIKKFIIILD